MPTAPNVLLAIADDWSAPHAGAYGCPWVSTPAFDRVAAAGLLFTRAHTPDAKCAPSRAALLTGRNPWQLEAAANHWCYFPAHYRTWPEALRAAGLHVGFTGKGWAPGVANDAEGQPRQLTGRPYYGKTIDPPTPDIARNDYAGNFATFLDEAPADQPWFFWYGGLEPHRRYTYGSGTELGGRTIDEIDQVPACWPDTPEVRQDMLDYAFEVEHFDRHLGLILDQIEAAGQLDNTLVIVTSDNGYPFPHAKGNTYADACRVPLAMAWAEGIAHPGQVRDEYVSLIDIAPTIAAACDFDLAAGGLAPITGQSLAPLLAAAPDERPAGLRGHVLLGRERHDVGRPLDQGYPVRGVVRDEWLYLHNYEPTRWPGCNPETGYWDTDSSPTKTAVLATRRDPAQRHHWQACFGLRPAHELYDLSSDPYCMTNLAETEPHAARRAAMDELLLHDLLAQEDPRAMGQGHVFDAYPYADEKMRGYYEQWAAGTPPPSPWFEAGDVDPDPD